MSTQQPPVTSLANRYGTPKPALAPRTRRVIIGSVLAAAVAGIAVFSLMTGIRPVTSKDVGFNIVGDTRAVVDFEVTKNPRATAQCAIQVLSKNYAVVGWKVVTIPASDQRTTAVRAELRTDSPGVSGGVNACWIVD
jgi:hypothetical protein